MTFDDLNLPEPLLQAVRDLGFVTPTPIQAAALPLVLRGKDVAGQAQTGTGKTACFLLGVLNNLMDTERPADGSPRAICIAPTRELAIQIAADAEQLSTYLDLDITVVCGGLSWSAQEKKLKAGTDLIVGTPGRLLDFDRKRILNLRKIMAVVVDEADRMFDMGFIQDINNLFRYMPRKGVRQSMMFSATLSDQVMRLARRHMQDPEEVRIAAEHLVVDLIEQELFHVGNFEKLDLLLGLLQKEQPHRAMVFVNRKVDGERLAWKLNHNGYEAVYLSGDLPQKKRLKIIEAMKAGQISILVATDVASRGIHVDDVTHVFNWDVPQDPEDYVHRIGRTARAGAKGKAITLACEETVRGLPAVEELIEQRVPVGFAEDGDFVPDRAGYFRPTRQVYTGWPPPSLGKALAKREREEEEADEDRHRSRGGSSDPAEGEGEVKKKRRRRRRKRKPAQAEGEASAVKSEDAAQPQPEAAAPAIEPAASEVVTEVAPEAPKGEA